MDDLGCQFADDVDPDQLHVLPAEEKFEKPGLVDHQHASFIAKVGQHLGANQLGEAVRIAIRPNKARLLAVLAGDVADQHRARQKPPILVDSHEFMSPKPLSPGHAGHGGEEKFEELHLGMGVQKSARLLGFGNEARQASQL